MTENPPPAPSRTYLQYVSVALVLAALNHHLFSARADGPAGDRVPSAKSGTISFARDIRPILSHHCGSCHGSDEATREAGLRLDQRESAIKVRTDGSAAIAPGKPAASALVARIEATDEAELMPPPDAKKPLSAHQKQLLKDWIAQGADYAPHWAFQPLNRPAPPATTKPGWVRNPIDRFVFARLESEGLSPSAEASRETLLRRVTLDLTGLPPSIEELDAFLADRSDDAYEKVVDRLLDSPRYAERMAMHWLDVARYADTNGYNNDEERTMWPWRDWVIDAFRRNLPYDQFVVEQLAGDLIPNATTAQRVATGFNRNHVLTTEGGIFEDEYRVEYVADRVHTTATVFMGLSLQCARCHDHKYDPVSQREYYRFFAYFNNLPDKAVGYNRKLGYAAPSVNVPSAAEQRELDTLAAHVKELEAAIEIRADQAPKLAEQWEAHLTADDRAGLAKLGLVLHARLDEVEGDSAGDAIDPQRRGSIRGKPAWTSGKLAGALEFDGETFVDFGQAAAFEASNHLTLAAWVYPASLEPSTIVSKIDEANGYRGYDLILEGGKVASHLADRWPENGLKVNTRELLKLNEWQHVALTYDGSRKAAGVRLYVNGKLQALEVANDKLTGTLATDKPLYLGRRHESAPFRGRLDDVRVFGIDLAPDDVARLAAGEPVLTLADWVAIPRPGRTAEQRAGIEKYYLEKVDVEHRRLKTDLAATSERRDTLDRAIPRVMVMEELTEPRTTTILRRGQYDQPGEPVTPGVPAALPALPPDAPANRLGLAQWLVDPSHPLTARVAVNRWWEMYFGAGLVETVEDFGVTGALPTHPDLLDWLASEFMSLSVTPPLSKGGQGGSRPSATDDVAPPNATPPNPPLLRGGGTDRLRGGGVGWNIKALQKLIVMSATYRQSSHLLAVHRERDPKNVLLSRGPRFRLPAEAVRDNALALSGLLVDRVGGPSVKPYQPEGLWEDVSVERREKYVPDPGDGLYRRTMYTFWKRTCPPPALSTFDAPTRETCTIRRARTNTPLQALVLLNDPTYLEAARKMAERVLGHPVSSTSERTAYAVRLAVSRPPTPAETETLANLQSVALGRFRADRDSAVKLLSIGRTAANSDLDPADLAAWTIVCTTILNMDETISKQ